MGLNTVHFHLLEPEGKTHTLEPIFGFATVLIVRSKLYALKISGNCHSKISKLFERVLTEYVEK